MGRMLTTKQTRPSILKKLKAEIEELTGYRDLALRIPVNAKGENLIAKLPEMLEEIVERGGNRKAVIFTESVRTQGYLAELLAARGYAGQIALLNGSNKDTESQAIYADWLARHQGTDAVSGSPSSDMKAAIVDVFRHRKSILIATESGAEGINLQFCSLLVNFDLPWNPQRVEQRIGRCHRYGQKIDVTVVNFINDKNQAERRIFQLLDQKFRLFDGVFGASDEVLGAIESGVDFERRVLEIVQSARSETEINEEFDRLQTDLQTDIDTAVLDARKRLLGPRGRGCGAAAEDAEGDARRCHGRVRAAAADCRPSRAARRAVSSRCTPSVRPRRPHLDDGVAPGGRAELAVLPARRGQFGHQACGHRAGAQLAPGNPPFRRPGLHGRPALGCGGPPRTSRVAVHHAADRESGWRADHPSSTGRNRRRRPLPPGGDARSDCFLSPEQPAWSWEPNPLSRRWRRRPVRCGTSGLPRPRPRTAPGWIRKPESSTPMPRTWSGRQTPRSGHWRLRLRRGGRRCVWLAVSPLRQRSRSSGRLRSLKGAGTNSCLSDSSGNGHCSERSRTSSTRCKRVWRSRRRSSRCLRSVGRSREREEAAAGADVGR